MSPPHSIKVWAFKEGAFGRDTKLKKKKKRLSLSGNRSLWCGCAPECLIRQERARKKKKRKRKSKSKRKEIYQKPEKKRKTSPKREKDVSVSLLKLLEYKECGCTRFTTFRTPHHCGELARKKNSSIFFCFLIRMERMLPDTMFGLTS